MKINSIIFHTTQLPELREFYEGQLNLKIGTYQKSGVHVVDGNDHWIKVKDPEDRSLMFETHI